MRVCVVGSGYVGLVTAACLADSGNHVIAVDKDAAKVERLSQGHSPIFEPGLEEMLQINLRADRLRFTTNLAEAVAASRIVFLAVGTPGREDGSPDLSTIEAVATEVGKAMIGLTIVVIKSTVPVGCGARVEELIRKQTRQPFHVVSNPEFLKEGSAVDDFVRPDRVVIGTDSIEAREILSELFKPFVRNNKPILYMSREASEMTKYAANAYLATRISFINEVAAICEKLSVDVDEVRRGIGSDERIGHHFLYPGAGYGGSCFPKDVQALAFKAQEVGVSAEILSAVHRRNHEQRAGIVRTIKERLGANLTGKRLVVWGLAFKPKTDDVREAPAIYVVEELLKAGAKVAVHDPRALESARAALGDRVSYHEDSYEPLAGADGLVIVTEWMEYRSPDFERIRGLLKQPLIFDGRNLYSRDAMLRHKFEYFSIGRPQVRLKSEK
jgi:UDPglucose 6-dehydrogenase